MLEVENIHTYYGLSHILFDVSIGVPAGEIVCLLGRNGAGKSTTMKSIMGLVPPKRGSVRYKGEEIAGKKPFQIARLGIGYVPDDRRVFADLTVGENLEISIDCSKTDAGQAGSHHLVNLVCGQVGISHPELFQDDFSLRSNPEV